MLKDRGHIMKIGILSKRSTHFTGKMKSYYEKKGFKVKLYAKRNLYINNSLLENDFFILKSKHLQFLYAGYFLEAHKIPVIPNTNISFRCKNRVEASFLLKDLNFNIPHIFLGTSESLNKISDGLFPLILKPLMGSGSKGVKLINSIKDIREDPTNILYLERFIYGIHYLVYFINSEICVCKKEPLENEHAPIEIIETPLDIKEIVWKWKEKTGLLFGHLDMVREMSSNKLYIVDPGTFPEFSNWEGNHNPVSKICDMIIEKYKRN